MRGNEKVSKKAHAHMVLATSAREAASGPGIMIRMKVPKGAKLEMRQEGARTSP